MLCAKFLAANEEWTIRAFGKASSSNLRSLQKRCEHSTAQPSTTQRKHSAVARNRSRTVKSPEQPIRDGTWREPQEAGARRLYAEDKL